MESLFELNRKHSFVDDNKITDLAAAEQVDCQRIVELIGDFFRSQNQAMGEERERSLRAETRVRELTEGLKETALLFKEREESFDSLARINKEQERKVSEGKLGENNHSKAHPNLHPHYSSINWNKGWHRYKMHNFSGVNTVKKFPST